MYVCMDAYIYIYVFMFICMCDTVVLLCHSPRYTGIYQTPTGPG